MMMAKGSASACPVCNDIARLIKPKIVTTEPNIKQCFQVSLILFRTEASLTRTLGSVINIARGTIFIFLSNAKLTHGSLEAAGGSTTDQGEGAEAAEAASVTEPVKL